MKYIVELENGVYIAPNHSRTLVEANAKQFVSERSAKRALSIARKMEWKEFKSAIIKPTEPKK